MAGGFTERAAPNRTKVNQDSRGWPAGDDRRRPERGDRARSQGERSPLDREQGSSWARELLLIASAAARYLLSAPQTLQVGRVQRNKKQQLQAGSRADRGCSSRGPGRAAALRPNGGHCPSGRPPIGPGDVPKTTVYGHEDLMRPAVVAADGCMPFTLMGKSSSAA